MSPEAAPKKRSFISRLLPQTLEGRLAAASAILLFLAVVVIWLVRWLVPDHVPVRHAHGTWWLVAEILLALIFIPVAVYWLVRPFDGAIAGAYPDIDRAWKRGLGALEDVGIPIKDLPLFLVLGCPDSRFERQLMRASGLEFKVDGVPHGDGVHFALHWYVTGEAIYLFCSDVGLSGAASRLARSTLRPVRATVDTVRDTLTVRQEPPRVQAWQESGSSDWESSTVNAGTVMADDSVGAGEPPGSVVIPAMRDEREIPSQPVPLDYHPSGTTATPDDLSSPAIDLPEQSAEGAIIQDAPPRQDRSKLASKDQDRPAPPLDIDTEDQLLRLQYLCRLIRVARHPYCGMNGMLTVLPYEISQATKTALSSLAQSIRKDIQVAQSTLQLRAPVSSVIVGLDRDDGFAELVRRLPAEYQGRRLGGRFDLTVEPTPDALNQHSDRLCDAFEDWIYMLFREPSAVQEHRGNRKLFRLLTRIRHDLKPQLRLLIGGAFGPNADQARREDPMFFSGCYFASIGMYGGPVAFIRGVLSDKLIREQAKVQWNGRARRWQAILRIVGAVGWLLLILAVLTLVAQLASPTLPI